jgi:hypothetical protein
VALLVARDFNAGKLKSVLPDLPACHMSNQREKNSSTFTPHTEMHTKLSTTLHFANLTIILSG